MFKILIVMFISISTFAKTFMVEGESIYLSENQIDSIQVAYSVGKSVVNSDGNNFADTLAAMSLAESSAGVGAYLIGDRFHSTGKMKTVYESSLGILQVQIETARIVAKKYPHIFKKHKHLFHNTPYAHKKYGNHLNKLQYFYDIKTNPKYHNLDKKKLSEKVKIQRKKTLNWAKREFKFHSEKLAKWKKQIVKDDRLAQKLMIDKEFNARIAAHYLLKNYEEAKSRNFWNPRFKTISRYNGGWHNKTYYDKVSSWMPLIRVLKQQGYLK